MSFPSTVALLLATLAALAAPASAQSVRDIARRGACSTSGVEGISRQLADAQMCIRPGAFVRFAPHPGITLSSSRIHPYAQASARDALHRAAARTPLTVNSAFRTLADQYVLYHSGGCGLAARPGRSNHQSGRAVDLSNYSAARSAMQGQGCSWLGSSDPVHFDCPGSDRRADAIRAFQRLWNVNNPGDVITEDGLYGPATESRLGRTPAGGFSRGACDAAPEPEPEPEPEPPVADAAGTLRGVVFEDTGAGLADTSARLSTASVVVTETGASVTTDGSGEWNLSLPAGTYSLVVSKSGFAAASRTCTVAAGGEAWCSVGLTAESMAGVMQGVLFVGSNVDERVVGANVRVVETGASLTSREGDGFFRFDLAPGTYTLEATGEGILPSNRTCDVSAGSVTWCSVSVAKDPTFSASRSLVVFEDNDSGEHGVDVPEDAASAADETVPGGALQSGCAAGGSGRPIALPFLLALFFLRRRR